MGREIKKKRKTGLDADRLTAGQFKAKEEKKKEKKE